jgi:cupin-like protein
MLQPSSVERIGIPNAETFKRELVRPARPAVIAGAARAWKATDRWTPEYLKAAVGQVPVRVSVSDDAVFGGDPRLGFDAPGRTQRMPVSEYIDLISSPQGGKRYYLQQQPLRAVFPALAADLEVPQYIPKAAVEQLNLWFGPSGSVSPLHYDASQNLLVQVTGRKRVILFAPQDGSKLYAHQLTSKLSHFSRVNVDAPDVKAFPKFAAARAFEATLEAGDALFIPSTWWHHVHTVETGISINIWWKPRFRDHFTTPMLRLKTSAWVQRLPRAFSRS